MFSKGKSVEKNEPSCIQNTAPSIDDSDADDCSSQFIEDILEPDSVSPIYVKGRDAETPNPSLPRLGGAIGSSTTRRALDPEEMDDASEGSAQQYEIDPDLRLDNTGDSGGGTSRGEGATNTSSAEISAGSLGLAEMVRQNFFTASTDDDVVEDTAESYNELSDYLEYQGWNSDSLDDAPQSTTTVVDLDSSEEIYEDEGFFDTPLDRVPSNVSRNSSSIGLGSSSMIYTENRSTRGSPGGSPRRGNTYNPTMLRGPQPVQLLSLERGWTPPPPRKTPREALRLSSESPPIADPPPSNEQSEDSDDPPSRGSGIYQGQVSSILPTGLETVVEEDEEGYAEPAVTRPSSPPYPRPPPRADFSTNLNTPSGSDSAPSNITSVYHSLVLASRPPIEDTQSSEQQYNTPILAPIYLAPIHLAPITLAPVSLGQAARLESDFPPDLLHIRVSTISLPEHPSQQVFTWNQTLSRSHNLLQIPPRRKTLSRFQKPPVRMVESINHFRDFVASTASITDRNIPAPLDGYWDEESPEDEAGNLGTSEGRQHASLKRTSRLITQPLVSSTQPSHIPRVVSMEERWGLAAPPANSSDEDRSRSRHTKDGGGGRVSWENYNIYESDEWNKRMSENEGSNRRPSSSRTYLPPSLSSDRELRTLSPDIRANVFPPQGNLNLKLSRSNQAPPTQKSLALENPGFRGYFKSVLEAIEHHSWQSKHSGANWSEVGDWNCQSCGWLSPSTSTECYHCRSTMISKIPRAGFWSIPGEPRHKSDLPEGSARNPLHQNALILEESERIELQAEESEPPHLPPCSSIELEVDNPRGRSKEKKKNNGRRRNSKSK